MKELVSKIIRGCGRRRPAVLGALVLVGLLAALAVALRGRFTNDVSRLFPDTRETRATFDVLHKSHLSDSVQLEFVTDGDVTKHAGYLERTAERLEKSPMVKRLTFRYRSDDLNAELEGFSKLAPRFYTPAELLDGCDPEAAAENARKQLANFTPGIAKRLRSQPFDWDRKILMRLKALDDATGMETDRALPFFATKDRRRAMIVVETDVRLGDADAVRKLFAELRACAEPLPEGVKMNIISGCSHTLGNEEVLKRDALIAGAVSLVLFLLIFACFCRGDWRALWIPVLPLYASLLALVAMTFLFREICFYVIGLGGCITGLAVDQGIHVCFAFRGGEAEKRTAALAEPMLLSAATSVAVFVFLAVTGISAYIQLACFAGMSLLFSAALALFVLPLLLDRDRRIRKVFRASEPPRFRLWGAAAVMVAVILAFAAMPKVVGNADFALDSLDGTPKKVLREEQEFREEWRKPTADTAVLACGGANGEAALERLESAAAGLRNSGVDVVMPPRPSLTIQRGNRELWRTPETAAKITDLEKRCREACRRRKLPEKFFDPFFAGLRKNIATDDLSLPPVLEHIDRRMVKSRDNSAAAVALLADTTENVRIVRAMLRRNGDGETALLSKGSFKQLISDELGGRFKWLLPLSIAAALAMLFAVFRRPGDVLLATVPTAVAFSGVTLLMYVTNFRATPAAAFALVLLTGLSVDYGIYAVSQLRNPGELDTRDPILFSAATTVAGAGALLTSRHPALFGTGVVLAPGIALACLSGIYLVPMLKKAKPPKQALMLFFAAAALALGSGCASATPWAEYPGAGKALRQMRPYPDGSFRIKALTTASFGGNRKFRFVLAAELDGESGLVKFAGVDPSSGALLFKHSGIPTEKSLLGEMLRDPIEGPSGMSAFLFGFSGDLRRIFLLKDDIPLAVTEKTEYITVDSSDGTVWELRRDGPAMRRRGAFPFRRWRTIYFDGGRRVIYDRYDGDMGYTLKIDINDLRQVKK